ncbi:MAG: hypothetical protein QF471_00170 [Phycisphaerales bacterium]|jgi:hypothetical protein|nr:hypothetical protein [Phycisphaerales bacterium]
MHCRLGGQLMPLLNAALLDAMFAMLCNVEACNVGHPPTKASRSSTQRVAFALRLLDVSGGEAGYSAIS